MLFRALEAFLFPLRRGQYALRLAFKINAGLAAQANRPHEAGDVVDSHVVGERVVIRIARLDDRLVHIDKTVPAFLVVAEGVAAVNKEPGIGNRLLRRALAEFERGERHERLEGGTRRIGAVQGPVDHRAIRRVVEQIPVLAAYPVDKQVGIEGRRRHHGQDSARGRLDRHQRATTVAKCLFGHLLEFGVERQGQIVAGNRRRSRKTAHGAPTGVDLDFLVTGNAVQLELVLLLQPGFSDVIRPLIVGRLFLGLDVVQILLVDAVDVADDVRRRRAERVVPEQPRLDIHPWKQITVRRETGHLFVAQARADRDALEGLALFKQFAETPPVLRLNVDVFADRVDGRVKTLLKLCRRDLERERRVVARQDKAIAILDHAPIRCDRHQRNPVVLRASNVVLVLDDLQEDKTPDQQAETQDHDGGGNQDTRAEAIEIAVAGVERNVSTAHEGVL